jgi:hypothetical protein
MDNVPSQRERNVGPLPGGPYAVNYLLRRSLNLVADQLSNVALGPTDWGRAGGRVIGLRLPRPETSCW